MLDNRAKLDLRLTNLIQCHVSLYKWHSFKLFTFLPFVNQGVWKSSHFPIFIKHSLLAPLLLCWISFQNKRLNWNSSTLNRLSSKNSKMQEHLIICTYVKWKLISQTLHDLEWIWPPPHTHTHEHFLSKLGFNWEPVIILSWPSWPTLSGKFY